MSISNEKRSTKWTTTWAACFIGILVLATIVITLSFTVVRPNRQATSMPTSDSSTSTPVTATNPTSTGAVPAPANTTDTAPPKEPTLQEDKNTTSSTPEDENTPAIPPTEDETTVTTTVEEPTSTTTNKTTGEPNGTTIITDDPSIEPAVVVPPPDVVPPEVNTENKTEWPELVGMPGEQAMAMIIREQNANIVDIYLVPSDAMVTMDYRTDRVRIFVNNDAQQTVARPPQIG